MTCPVTWSASSEASQATNGEETAGSIRFHSSSGTSSASITSGAPGIVPVIRVAAAGPTALTVTPILYISRLSVWVRLAMAALAGA